MIPHIAKYPGSKLPNTSLTMEAPTISEMQHAENVGMNYKRDCDVSILRVNAIVC
jgi:hypothetical protein